MLKHICNYTNANLKNDTILYLMFYLNQSDYRVWEIRVMCCTTPAVTIYAGLCVVHFRGHPENRLSQIWLMTL